MVWFIFFATLGWSGTSLLLLVDPTAKTRGAIRQGESLRIHERYAEVKNVALWTFSFVLAALLLVFMFILAFVRFREFVALYRWYDYFNHTWFSQCVLGIVFGAVLALWLRSIYFLKSGKDMSMPQKIEGIALILLFLVGSSSTSLFDLLKGASFDAGGVALKLAGASADGGKSTEQPNNILPYNNISPGCGDQCSGEEYGFRILGDLNAYMKADAKRISADLAALYADKPAGAPLFQAKQRVASIWAASIFFDSSLNNYIGCIRMLNTATKDVKYGRSEILSLRTVISELYAMSNDWPGGMQTSATAGNLSSTRTADALASLLKDFKEKFKNFASDLKIHASRIPQLVDKNNLCSRKNPDPHGSAEFAGFMDRQRPYLALLYAALLQLDHQELDAIEVLEAWQTAYETSAQASGQVSDAEKAIAKWFRLRVHNAQYLLYESLFRRDPVQPLSVVKNHLAKTEQVIDLLNSIPRVRKVYEQAFEGSHVDLVGSNFAKDADYPQICPDGATTDEMMLSNVLLLSKAVFTLRAIRHPSLARANLRKVNLYAEQIANADYGCLDVKLGAGNSQAERAEHMRVFALYAQSRIQDFPIAGRDANAWILDQLRKEIGALNVAKSIVEKYPESVTPTLREELDPLLEEAQSLANRMTM